MHKKIVLLLIFLMVLTLPAASVAQLATDDFVDVKGSWAEPEIQTVCQLGIMNGTGTDAQGFKVFTPEGLVSRAQLSSVLVRTFRLDYGQIRFIKEPAASDYYRDVDNKAWYASDVLMCAINKIFASTEKFYPDSVVSRIEIARAIQQSFTAKGIVIPMIMSMPIYEDTNSLSQQDMNAMIFVNNTGIMKGDGTKFRPGDNVKRAELAMIMKRCSELSGVNENNNGQEYTVAVGQSFVVSLASNPTTGYVWNVSKPEDEKVLAKTDGSYVSDGNSSQMIPGQGGRNYWKFTALQAGTTEISMVYARPWESVQPAQTFTLKVIVKQVAAPKGPLVVSLKELKEESANMKVDLNIPVLQGMIDDKAQTAINAQFEKDVMDIKTELISQLDRYVQNAKQNDYPIRSYELVTRYQECYQNEKFLSMYLDYYQYTGGAHGMTERRPYNIDLTTGKKLTLKELFQDNYDYKSIIDQEVRKQISLNPKDYFSGDMGFKGIAEDRSFYIQEGFLVVYFGQYEIAPYSSGIREFKIPFTQFPSGLSRV